MLFYGQKILGRGRVIGIMKSVDIVFNREEKGGIPSATVVSRK